jgi:hypothetical protein
MYCAAHKQLLNQTSAAPKLNLSLPPSVTLTNITDSPPPSHTGECAWRGAGCVAELTPTRSRGRAKRAYGAREAMAPHPVTPVETPGCAPDT